MTPHEEKGERMDWDDERSFIELEDEPVFNAPVERPLEQWQGMSGVEPIEEDS
jgi:hypothetical protein